MVHSSICTFTVFLSTNLSSQNSRHCSIDREKKHKQSQDIKSVSVGLVGWLIQDHVMNAHQEKRERKVYVINSSSVFIIDTPSWVHSEMRVILYVFMKASTARIVKFVAKTRSVVHSTKEMSSWDDPFCGFLFRCRSSCTSSLLLESSVRWPWNVFTLSSSRSITQKK